MLKTVLNGALCDLSIQQTVLWQQFVKALNERVRLGDVLQLYRGTRMAYVRRNSAPGLRDPKEILEAFFQLGEKARRMHANQADQRWGINEFSLDFCTAIVAQISEAVASNDPRGRGLISNAEFFSKPNAAAELHSTVVSAYKSNVGRMKIRNYYLFLLHTLGTLGIRSGSPLLSASTHSNVARAFSLARNEKNAVVLEIFVPKPFDRWVVSPWHCSDVVKRVSSLGLPTYSPFGAHPDQCEVGIKGGALPHFISHMHLQNERLLVVNPAVFEDRNRQFARVFKWGLAIDQDRFFEYLNKSGYDRYLEVGPDRVAREYDRH